MSTRAVTILGFVIIIAALITLEILGRRSTNRIPTLSEWLGYVMRLKTGRALILLGWLWLGWHYFARLAATFARLAATIRLSRQFRTVQVSLSYPA